MVKVKQAYPCSAQGSLSLTKEASTDNKHVTPFEAQQATERCHSPTPETSPKKLKVDEEAAPVTRVSCWESLCVSSQSPERPRTPELHEPTKKIKLELVCQTVFKAVVFTFSFKLKLI